MKYIRQVGVILGFTLLGELCQALIPVSIPASIYGMVLLFAALALKLIPVAWIKETSSFLVGILPLLFVVPTVGLLDCWELIAPYAVKIGIVILLSTVLTFGVAGCVTDRLFARRKKYDDSHTK